MYSVKKPYILMIIPFFIVSVFVSSGMTAPAEAPGMPRLIDNSKRPFFPAIFDQEGESCASASGVGYIFTYEINAVRGTAATDSLHRYPYNGTYNFLNDGSRQIGTPFMFRDAWEIITQNGIMNEHDFGPPDEWSTKWVTGYDHYLEGMRNRIATTDSLSFGAPGAVDFFKKWLVDHGDGSPYGGLILTIVCAAGIQDDTIRSGAEKGKYVVRSFGNMPDYGLHTLTIVGFNDDVPADANNDGIITDSVDLNDDEKIDLRDSEHGAFLCANTWGYDSWDSGFVYVPYRVFALPFGYGGPMSNKGYYMTARKEYRPRRTFRLTITHESRNAIALSVGIAPDSNAVKPVYVRNVRQFTYAGGNLPMGGYNLANWIEFGLDVTDLADSAGTSESAAYFLIIEAGKSGGNCDALSLVDYSASTAIEYPAGACPLTISEGTNLIRIAAPASSVRNRPNQARNDRPDIHLFHRKNATTVEFTSRISGLEIVSPDGKYRYRNDGIVGNTLTLPRLPHGVYCIKWTQQPNHQVHHRSLVIP